MAEVWAGKRVLVTGHTGFKGAWLVRWLTRLGAEVVGVGLPPDTSPSLSELLGPLAEGRSIHLDIRQGDALAAVLQAEKPEVIFHLAAQSLVRRSYREPLATWQTNVIGTANLLEAARGLPALRAIVVVTSDKVYENAEDGRAFTETSRLGGSDPYASSKAAAELVAHCWRQSFLSDGPRIVSARAGNVIGGGDWCEDRLIPDLVRAVCEGQPLRIRNPDSERPWQHVLDPLSGYIRYAEQAAWGEAPPLSLNFGPSGDQASVRSVAEIMLAALGREAGWEHVPAADFAEHRVLALDSSMAKRTLGWRCRLSTGQALKWTAEWYSAWRRGEDMAELTDLQISRYERIEVEGQAISP